jgi:hypothetical protein
MSRPSLLLITRLWFLFLLLASLQPVRPGPVHDFHRELHWLAFAMAAFLLFALSRSRRQAICGAIAAFTFGLCLEFLQHLIYRNPMEWWDVRDDAFAVLGAFAIYRLTLARSPAPEPSRVKAENVL